MITVILFILGVVGVMAKSLVDGIDATKDLTDEEIQDMKDSF